MKHAIKLLSFVTIGLLAAANSLSAADALKIGVAWETKSGMADRVTLGLTDAMKTLAPQVEIEVKKDLKDVAELGEVAKKFDAEKSAYVLMRSTGGKYLGANPPKTVGFFGSCGDPVQLGILKNSAVPEGRVTGVTYAIPYQTQLQTMLSVIPKTKSVLLLCEVGHPGSPLDQAGTKAACEKLKLEYSEKICTTKDEAIAAAKEAEAKGAAVVLGSQALLINNGGQIAGMIKTPVFSYSEKPVGDGALAGLVADDYKLGTMLADSIVDVLVKGKAIKDVPVKTDTQPQLLINVVTAKRLGLEIPFDILSAAKIIEK